MPATKSKTKPKHQPQKGKPKMATQPAKTRAAAAEERENLPATTHQAYHEPPAELREMMEQDKGKGVSTAAQDNLVPLIYVLQALSPQVNRRNPAYIEGAEPGAFWCRNAPQEIIAGDPEEGGGMIVQPCYYYKDWIEWKPRDSGGGFIGRHDPFGDERDETLCPVADAVRTEDPQNNRRIKWIRPNGNEVIFTRNHVVRVFTPQGIFPFIIPFSSTGHTTSRGWMQLINTTGGAVAFAGKYRLTTRERSNPAGTWFAVDVKFESWCSPDDYKIGKQLHEAFARGEKQAEAPVASGGGEGSGASGDDIPF